MGLFSEARDILLGPLTPDARVDFRDLAKSTPEQEASAVVDSTRNALMSTLKLVASTTRAVVRSPFALVAGTAKAGGTFLENRWTLNKRRVQDAWLRLRHPLTGNFWDRFTARHSFEKRAYQSFAEEMEPLAEPLYLLADVPLQIVDAVRGTIRLTRMEMSRVFSEDGEPVSPAVPRAVASPPKAPEVSQAASIPSNAPQAAPLPQSAAA